MLRLKRNVYITNVMFFLTYRGFGSPLKPSGVQNHSGRHTLIRQEEGDFREIHRLPNLAGNKKNMEGYGWIRHR